MRVVASTVVALVAASALGQVTANELVIQQAFAKLRLEPEVMLSIDGVDRLGSQVKTLSSNAFFRWDPMDVDKGPILSEINDWVNGVHTRRIVGDGTTLWNYDFGRNAYSTFKYGSYAGAKPEGFRSNMLSELTTASQGPSVFTARALKEIFSGKEAQYRTWLPMAQITVIDKGNTMDDPIVPRTYTGSDNDLYIVYTYNARLLRSGAFHLQRSSPLADWYLSEVFYADKQQVTPSTSKTVDWMITVSTGAALPVASRYTFVPPTTAKSISNVRGGSGG